MKTSLRERDRRILQAISECDAFIDRESPRRADLRPAEVQRTLDFYIAHKQALINRLAGVTE